MCPRQNLGGAGVPAPITIQEVAGRLQFLGSFRLGCVLPLAGNSSGVGTFATGSLLGAPQPSKVRQLPIAMGACKNGLGFGICH